MVNVKILIIGIILVVGALLFMNYYNSQSENKIVSQMSNPDYASLMIKFQNNRDTIDILCYVGIFIGAILVINGLISRY